MTVLCFDPLSSETLAKNLLQTTDGIANLTIYGPDAAVVGGHKAPWRAPPESPISDVSERWPFWDHEKHAFRLGDFRFFVEFLRSFLGRGWDLVPAEPSPNA